MTSQQGLLTLCEGMRVRYYNREYLITETRPLNRSDLPAQFLHRLQHPDGVSRWLWISRTLQEKYRVALWTRRSDADTQAPEPSRPSQVVIDKRQFRFMRGWGYTFTTRDRGQFHQYLEYGASDGSDYIVFVKFPDKKWEAYTGRDIPESEIIVVG